MEDLIEGIQDAYSTSEDTDSDSESSPHLPAVKPSAITSTQTITVTPSCAQSAASS